MIDAAATVTTAKPEVQGKAAPAAPAAAEAQAQS